MKKLNILSALALTLIGLSLPINSFAADKPAKPDAPAGDAAAKKEKPLPYEITVDSVDKGAKTFTAKSKSGERVFKVTDATKIMNMATKMPATFDDIAAGAYVTGAYLKKDDGLEAYSVHLGKTAPAKGDKKSAKKDKAEPTDKPATADKPALTDKPTVPETPKEKKE